MFVEVVYYLKHLACFAFASRIAFEWRWVLCTLILYKHGPFWWRESNIISNYVHLMWRLARASVKTLFAEDVVRSKKLVYHTKVPNSFG